MGDKDIISKELLKEMAKDISRHILHIKDEATFRNYLKKLKYFQPIEI